MEEKTMLRFLIAVPLFLHGMAHISGFLASWTRGDFGYSPRPWLISSGVHLNSGVGRVFGLLWLIAMAGLVGAALGLVFRQEWWPWLAVTAAVLSLIVIIPWWNTVPAGARFGAIFDLLLLAVLLSPLQIKLFDLIQ
jgi:hypothetical protein